MVGIWVLHWSSPRPTGVSQEILSRAEIMRPKEFTQGVPPEAFYMTAQVRCDAWTGQGAGRSGQAGYIKSFYYVGSALQ